MTRTSFVSAAIVAGILCAANLAQAANVWWEGGINSNWEVGGATNWNLGGTAGALTTFTNGDTVRFEDDGDGLNDNGTVTIDAGGVSPASTTFNRGFGKVYTITGGDILTGAINGTRDDTKNFNRDGSYSFPGGTFATAGGSIFNYAPTSLGTYNFGTGTITVQHGQFNFNPLAAATITNNFVLSGGGSITGNANASFTGNLTMAGNTINAPGSSAFVFPSITLGQNTTVNMSRCCGAAPAVQFNSSVDGLGIHSLTLGAGTGNADWISRAGAPATSWNVLNISKTERGLMQFDANDPDDFFSGVKANGGTFFLRGGTVQFRTAAQVNIPTLNLDFRMMFDPAAAMIGPNPNQTGAGFFGLTTLNIINGGVLGGNGTVARASGLGGHNPTFDATMSVVVNNGGQISPGLSVGTLNINGNVTMNSGSEIYIEVDGGGAVAGVDYDRLNVVGSINGLNNADLVVDFSEVGFGDVLGDVLTIITSTNDLSPFTFNSVTLIAPFSADVTYGNGFITLSNFQVPEPSTCLLVALGGLGLASQVRRRARRFTANA